MSSTADPSGEHLRERAREHLRALTGRPDAEFHDGQFEAIEALVAGRRRALVVQRTGWGKSAVYFIASLLIREAAGAARPSLIVSPLLALMRDQVAAAERAGVRAASVNSTNPEEFAQIRDKLHAGELDVLLISPERLTNERFRAEQLPFLMANAGLLVIDEAHCISDWGHDFRPDYRRIRDLIAELPAGFPVLATTATANARVVADVAEQLGAGLAPGEEVFTLRGPLARASLRLGVVELDSNRQRLGWLLSHLDELPGSGIIYALTVSAAEDTARLLADAGHDVRAYTGRSDLAERQQAEADLKDNKVKALVATSALGMGFDKPDLGFVVHLGAPGSPVAYYQQVGRAGRATESADVILLPGHEDSDIWRWFATSSMPTQRTAGAVLDALAAEGPLSVPALESRVDIRRTKLELLLKVLAVEGAVRKAGSGWERTGAEWAYDAERYERIAQAREDEQAAMKAYQRTDGCRMEFLAAQLDDPHAQPCGRCDNCVRAAGGEPWLATGVPASAGERAAASLDRPGVVLEPRGQWPSGMDRFGADVRGKLKPDESAEPGRVLARLSDLGWGTPLRELFATDGDGRPVDAEVPAVLARACVEVLRGWEWAERPVGVVAMPSRSRPRLIRSLATGLAQVGRLVDLGDLELVGELPPSGSSGNSAWRLGSVRNAFAVGDELAARLPNAPGPILLVDDFVDSRWTMTVAARLLRQVGAPAVLPFALAQQG
ncbi:ATP-dependent DNA helicase RecQ [Naumannella cuiyingiana]|uniref:DNA 3'-5' helicase n=1 Tax=Naumannella cuiyingiana TaxID=1347891 RepID=A0A7Z0DAI0_9ACTN|nr:DEAD/DEAH box helicase [Naumannella cuiyingiana]NYI71984.1 ATP-dependent DNA helicase RecQ [Naumannella cuiyingiana]